MNLKLNLKTLFIRQTSSGKVLPVIDGFRCLAMLFVVLYHLQDYLLVKTNYSAQELTFSHFLRKGGSLGVQFFFAISGFIVALSFLQRRNKPLPIYLMRRFSRLSPPYIINLIVIFTLLILVLKQDFLELLPSFFASVFYLHNILFGEMSKINFVTWTLEVEIQFYLLAPIIFFLLLKINSKFKNVLIAFILLIWGFIQVKTIGFFPLKGSNIFQFLGYFIAGILTANIFIFHDNFKPKRSFLGDVMFFSSLSVLLVPPNEEFVKLLAPFLIFIVFCSLLHSKMVYLILTQPLFYLIGGISYTIYLYHFYVISFIGRFLLPYLPGQFFELDFIFAVIIIFPFILLVSVFFYIFFERPFMSGSIKKTVEKPTI